MEQENTDTRLKAEMEELRFQLEEANETISAIRNGEIDALVVKGSNGNRLYTLKSADQTYRLFIEKMNEGAITLNKEGLILYANSRFASLVNMPLSKVVGLLFIDLVVDSQQEAFRASIDKAWHNESKGEISLLKTNGHPTPCLYSLSTLELEEGTAVTLILADLSLQKENERRLRESNKQLLQAKKITETLNKELEETARERANELLMSREHFKFLADNIPVIAWKAGPDGELDYFNKRWYEFTGGELGNSDQLANWSGFIHPDDRHLAMAAWKNAVSKAIPFHIEYRFKRAADDKYIWHIGNALPYKNENDAVVAWFGIATDIEFQKKALEQKDEFINMVSHELKTPVTSLKGFTQLLMLSTQNDESKVLNGYLATMNNQINKLTRLIADLLDATKFNGGQLQFNNELFDFNSLAKEITNEMQLTSGKHSIVVELDKNVTILGDKNRIGQVITNLISNAIKYSPNADSILVTTSCNDGILECCVKDFGIGIPREQQSNLYTRFFRVTDNNAHTYPGLGLGLYISMGIIKKHHGDMRVVSELGKGSEFYFTLPYVKE